ncbi:MAG TPA: hypothetical protein VFE18_13665 [Phenylobacterium sp.]|uniref:hypothetical protein n=1 Tax=Phenylobacterium sp. TaxID=1871053 RepID=UPI002D5C7FC2|nr:hypothetical protein [Phenylobacterium sp.]HZZ69215.1 hypothetical protein [Phenylobacterium sp.]
MNAQDQIDRYISEQAPSKREEMQSLHHLILKISPECRLWFLDGRNDEGKIVSNPNIGYGSRAINYASGKSREFYEVGLSANTTGISVYIVGIGDKKYLSTTYGERLGRATVTGYCIKFRSVKDLNIAVLEEMIANHMNAGAARGSSRP